MMTEYKEKAGDFVPWLFFVQRTASIYLPDFETQEIKIWHYPLMPNAILFSLKFEDDDRYNKGMERNHGK